MNFIKGRSLAERSERGGKGTAGSRPCHYLIKLRSIVYQIPTELATRGGVLMSGHPEREGDREEILPYDPRT